MKTLRQVKVLLVASFTVALLVGIAIGVAKCPIWGAQKKQRTIESVEKQLEAGGQIYYEDLARQAYEDSGWSDDRVLRNWLTAKQDDPIKIQNSLKEREKRVVWLVPTRSPERDIVARYKIGVHDRHGPIKTWDFYVDKAGMIRAYVP